jgi:Arc/MetJ-type ribon-helix-helix transcriptional regulator
MMQTKVSLDEDQMRFIKRHKKYGFRDRSALVREAISRFQQELERQALVASADLYAELYDEDEELVSITESAIDGWPE